MSEQLNKTVKGISSQTVVTIILGLLELLVFSLMSRLLTKAEFGYYAAILSVVMIFRSLAEAGIGASVIQKHNADKEFVNSAYSLSLIVGCLATLVVVSFSGILADFIADETIRLPLILLSLTLIPYSLNSVYRGLFLKELHFLKVGIFQIVAFVISNSIAIAMAIMGYGLYAIVTGNILNIILQNLILRIALKDKLRFQISQKKVREIIGFGGWLTLSRLTGTIYAQIDKILMAKWLSIVELGNFYRIRGIIEAFNDQIGGIYDVVLFPVLSRIQDNKQAIQNAYIKSLNVGCIFFSYLFLTFFFNAKLIIFIFLGEKWTDQILLFRVLSLSMLFYFITRFADCFIRSLALVKFGFFIKLLSCAMLIAAIYFSYSNGVIFIALSVVLVNLLSAIIKTIYLCRHADLSLMTLLVKTSRGLIYSIPLVVLGIVYMAYFEDSYVYAILFMIVYAICSITLFLCCPALLGEVYQKELYPIMQNYKQLFLNRFTHETI